MVESATAIQKLVSDSERLALLFCSKSFNSSWKHLKYSSRELKITKKSLQAVGADSKTNFVAFLVKAAAAIL
jgi:hypothetical protein